MTSGLLDLCFHIVNILVFDETMKQRFYGIHTAFKPVDLWLEPRENTSGSYSKVWVRT